MDGLVGNFVSDALTFSHSRPFNIGQGRVVEYFLPYALDRKAYEKTPQLLEPLRGAILTGDPYNRKNDRPCVCPILEGRSLLNEIWGIEIPSFDGKPRYLRPDLATFIAIDHANIRSVPASMYRQCFTVTPELTVRAWRKLIDILRPTEEKLSRRGLGFLAYGEIGQTEAFPRSDQDIYDRAPIINLTPPEIYNQTGVALVARAYSNTTNYHPHHDVIVGTQRWFKEGYFSVADFMVVAIRGILTGKSGYRSISAGTRAMKAFAIKEEGKFDPAVCAEIAQRYTTPRGCYKPYLHPSGYKSPCLGGQG